MSKPPKIVIPGMNRGAGVPGGFVLGRRRGSKQGPVELLNLTQMRAIGVATVFDVTQGISQVASTVTSLSTAVGSGGGTNGFDGGSASAGGRGFVLDGGDSAVRTDLDYWIDGGTA